MKKDVFIAGAIEKYPKELLEGRISIEGNVIASLWKDALLLDECELDTKDFITKDGIYYFALAKNLKQKGFNSFDEVTVLSNLTEELELGFINRGGWDAIQNIIDVINITNWETYLDILYRENIILGLYNDGFNVLKEIESNGKKIIPIKLFRKMDSESVLDWYEARLTTYGTGYSSKVLEEEEIDFDDEFIESCIDGLENGVPFDTAGKDINGNDINCFPFLSNQINGLLEGTTTMLGGFSSAGKSTWWITVIMALLNRDRKVLIISNEEKIKKFKVKFMIWLLAKRNRYFKLTKSKFTNGDISKESREQLNQIQEFWKKNYKGRIKFICINDADMHIVKKKIRENVLRFGYDAVLYDTFKIQESDLTGQRQDLALVRDSRELDKMSKKYNIIMLASIQLAEYMKGKLFLDSSVLSNSKQIKEVLENLFLMRTVYDEELDPKSKNYCRPFRLTKVGDRWIEEEYEPDRTAVWRLLFNEKSRSGTNSSDTGVAYLLKFDGNHSLFREVAQCRPRHGKID